jgi:hypothetical protein
LKGKGKRSIEASNATNRRNKGVAFNYFLARGPPTGTSSLRGRTSKDQSVLASRLAAQIYSPSPAWLSGLVKVEFKLGVGRTVATQFEALSHSRALDIILLEDVENLGKSLVNKGLGSVVHQDNVLRVLVETAKEGELLFGRGTQAVFSVDGPIENLHLEFLLDDSNSSLITLAVRKAEQFRLDTEGAHGKLVHLLDLGADFVITQLRHVSMTCSVIAERHVAGHHVTDHIDVLWVVVAH